VSQSAPASPNLHGAAKPAATPLPSFGGRFLEILLTNPAFLGGTVLLVLFLLVALLAGVLYPDDPLGMVARPLLWPGEDWAYPLGTDSLGRDVAALVAHGSRVSIIVGLSSALIGLGIGLVVGAVGGYVGGWTDSLLMRLTELFQTVPTFLLVIIIVAISEPSVATIAFAIGVASWPTIARLVRAEFRSLREADFVMAARATGSGSLRIIVLEILPNALPPVIVSTSVLVANAILTEAGLSFLRMGDPNAISWGGLIGQGRDLLRVAWFLTAVPGVAVALAVLSLNLVGDGLNDVLNPRRRRRS